MRLTRDQQRRILYALFQEARTLGQEGKSIVEIDKALRALKTDLIAAYRAGLDILPPVPDDTEEAQTFTETPHKHHDTTTKTLQKRKRGPQPGEEPKQ